jgi:hypothetical protein
MDIVDICQGLLTLTAVKGDKFSYLYPYILRKDKSIMIIQLAHFSVKEYLLSSRSASWMLTEEASHISTPVFIYFRNLLKAILKCTVSADISNALKGMLKLPS